MKFSRPSSAASHTAAFTMVEIALALAIVGFSLIAIIKALPTGMDVQKNNRRETIINQDANYLLDAIRNGAGGLDDLTNYLLSVTNYWTLYDANGRTVQSDTDTYTNVGADVLSWPRTQFKVGSFTYPALPIADFRLTNGARIIGVLSTPKYIPHPIAGQPPGFISNYVVAYFRALSGAASDKSPQDNELVRGAAFSYRIIPEVVPFATYVTNAWLYTTGSGDLTNAPLSVSNISRPSFTNAIIGIAGGFTRTNSQQELISYLNVRQNLNTNLHEVRLYFRWPLLPGNESGQWRLGNGRYTYRAVVGGAPANDSVFPWLWYFRNQYETNSL